jgi:ribonuclease HI
VEEVRVFTDGACFPNPGRGGWGVVVVERDGKVRCLKGAATGQTTSNRMEMTAVLMALRAFSRSEVSITLHSDSQLVIRTLRGRYRRSKNLDLWSQIDHELERFKAIRFEWVRGHAGNHYNEMADRLANEAAGVPGGLPTRAGYADTANTFWDEVDRSRYEPAGANLPRLKCHHCRQPMRLLSQSDRHTDGQVWFRCDSCRISGFKDRYGAHYVSATMSAPRTSSPFADPNAIMRSQPQ